MKRWTYGLCCLLAALPLGARAQTAADRLDLTTLDAGMTGPRAQVLVLGTVHLSGMPASFKPAALDGVLDRLAAYKPEIITVEDEPGEECDTAARHPAKYGADYCSPTAEAQAATGLDIPAALAEINATLKAWPAQPTPAQRRRLAAAFLAAHDPASGYVQWLQLPEGERRAGDGLDAKLVAMLGRIGGRNNENYQIAARLAARLGLQRVHQVDNHTGDRMDLPDIKAFVRSLEAAWAAGSAQLAARQKQEETLSAATDLLPLYRYINTPESLKALAEVNVSASLRARSPDGYPQMFVAGWEIRNLRMVANVRETFRERPGARVLAIVGSSHKPWFDAWLGQLQGVDIVDVEAVLK